MIKRYKETNLIPIWFWTDLNLNLVLTRFAVFTGITHIHLKIKKIVNNIYLLNESFSETIYKFGIKQF